MITVISKRRGGFRPDTSDGVVIAIDRGTPLGNPIAMRNSSSEERDRVIGGYQRWLSEKIKNRDQVVCNELNRIYLLAKKGNVYLECWCKPLKCHGDIIKATIEEKL